MMIGLKCENDEMDKVKNDDVKWDLKFFEKCIEMCIYNKFEMRVLSWSWFEELGWFREKKKKRRGNWGGGDVIVFVGVFVENIIVCCEFDFWVYKRINVLIIFFFFCFGLVGDLFN